MNDSGMLAEEGQTKRRKSPREPKPTQKYQDEDEEETEATRFVKNKPMPNLASANGFTLERGTEPSSDDHSWLSCYLLLLMNQVFSAPLDLILPVIPSVCTMILFVVFLSFHVLMM